MRQNSPPCARKGAKRPRLGAVCASRAFVVDVAGTALTPDEERRLASPLVGGVILFARNFESKEQLRRLCAQIKSAQSPSPVIFVDQEGGRVQRFKTGLAALPPARAFERLAASEGLGAAKAAARRVGFLMASELIECGVDMSFAPVADVARIEFGPKHVIGDRSFGASPAVAAALSRAFGQGMREAGMARCAKHFPGHGSASGDSHLTTPAVEDSFEIINRRDLPPFRALIADGCESIMTAHVVCKARDPDNVASYSRPWIAGVLRRKLGFRGLVFSDDLGMAGAGAGRSPTERALKALEAGCEALLLCNLRCEPQDDPLREPNAGLLQTRIPILAPMAAAKLAALAAKPPRSFCFALAGNGRRAQKLAQARATAAKLAQAKPAQSERDRAEAFRRASQTGAGKTTAEPAANAQATFEDSGPANLG